MWFLVNDRLKLLAYWILDRTQAGATPQARAQQKLAAKAEVHPDAKPEAKVEPKPEAKTESEPVAKSAPTAETDAKDPRNATPQVTSTAKAEPPSDLKAQIAERAYELYQRRAHGENQPDQDWLEAERDIRKQESLK